MNTLLRESLTALPSAMDYCSHVFTSIAFSVLTDGSWSSLMETGWALFERMISLAIFADEHFDADGHAVFDAPINESMRVTPLSSEMSLCDS